VNESIEQQALKFGGLHCYEFICECASTTCFERITLSLSEYERVRASGTTFFLAPHHEVDEVELVVERHPSYWVVEKDGHGAVVAEFADPRDGDPS
jgi:hypothetical protein